MYTKTYKCQLSAKRYGLEDITLNFNKNINFPYYGLTFAEKKDFNNGVYEYVSYWKEDNKCADFKDTLAHKLLSDPRVKVGKREYTLQDENDEVIYTDYTLLYYNPDCSIFKPSILFPISFKDNTTYKITYEFLFAFSDGWILPVEHVAETDEVLKWSNVEYWKDYLSDIEEDICLFLYESPSCHIENIGKEDENIDLEVSNLLGDYDTLSYNKYTKQDIVNALVSVRIIDLKKRNSSNEEWQSVSISFPFTEQ